MALVAVLLSMPPAAPAQTEAASAPRAAGIPYQAWAEAGEVQQVRWRVNLTRPELRYDQRHQVVVQVRMRLSDLQRESVQRELHFLIKVADGHGNWLPGEAYRVLALQERLRGRREVNAQFPVLLRPGEHHIGVFLYERHLRQRNFTRLRVQVPPPRRDPLPEMGRNLPAVEFPRSVGPTAIAPPARAALWLPAASRRPLHIEIIANASASHQYAGSARAHRQNLENVLQILSVLSHLRPQRGSVNLTVLDVLSMEPVFSQRNIRELDWEELLAATGRLNPLLVDKRALEHSAQTAAYFHQQVLSLLTRPLQAGEAEPAPGGAGAPPDALRVIIVVGNPMLLPSGTPVPRLELAGEECDCRVYLLQPKVRQNNLWDELGRVFQPLRPRRFTFDQPLQFRQALARMLDELREAQ